MGRQGMLFRVRYEHPLAPPGPAAALVVVVVVASAPNSPNAQTAACCTHVSLSTSSGRASRTWEAANRLHWAREGSRRPVVLPVIKTTPHARRLLLFVLDELLLQ